MKSSRGSDRLVDQLGAHPVVVLVAVPAEVSCPVVEVHSDAHPKQNLEHTQPPVPSSCPHSSHDDWYEDDEDGDVPDLVVGGCWTWWVDAASSTSGPTECECGECGSVAQSVSGGSGQPRPAEAAATHPDQHRATRPHDQQPAESPRHQTLFNLSSPHKSLPSHWQKDQMSLG